MRQIKCDICGTVTEDDIVVWYTLPIEDFEPYDDRIGPKIAGRNTGTLDFCLNCLDTMRPPKALNPHLS